MIRQSERIQIYSQSSQTPLTDCFTLTGSSEGNLKQHTALQNYFYITNVPQKFNYSYSKTMSFNYGKCNFNLPLLTFHCSFNFNLNTVIPNVNIIYFGLYYIWQSAYHSCL